MCTANAKQRKVMRPLGCALNREQCTWAGPSCDCDVCCSAVCASSRKVTSAKLQRAPAAPFPGVVAPKMPPRTKPVFLVGSVAAGLLLVGFCAVVSLLGGFLNHCRGSYAHFDREWWSQPFLGKMVFVIPTALIVVSLMLTTTQCGSK